MEKVASNKDPHLATEMAIEILQMPITEEEMYNRIMSMHVNKKEYKQK